jgi:hypothetical protein
VGHKRSLKRWCDVDVVEAKELGFGFLFLMKIRRGCASCAGYFLHTFHTDLRASCESDKKAQRFLLEVSMGCGGQRDSLRASQGAVAAAKNHPEL